MYEVWERIHGLKDFFLLENCLRLLFGSDWLRYREKKGERRSRENEKKQGAIKEEREVNHDCDKTKSRIRIIYIKGERLYVISYKRDG